VIILDTHAVIYLLLEPKRLSARAKKIIDLELEKGGIGLADITLWEIAMLIRKKRLKVESTAALFLKELIQTQWFRIYPIDAEIAAISQSDEIFFHFDPADRLIAATALRFDCALVSADSALQAVSNLKIIW